MIVALLTLAIAAYGESLPAAPPTEARAIDRVISETPRLDATEPGDALTEKIISACLQAHGGDATLCRSRTTLESGEDVSRQRVEQQKTRLNPAPSNFPP